MVKKIIPVLLSSIWLLAITSCAFKSVSRTKDITYLASDSSHNSIAQELNVFAPKKQGKLKEVVELKSKFSFRLLIDLAKVPK